MVLHALARLTGAQTDERAWRVGAKGERRTARALERLERRGWTILHDITVGTRGANIDHVAIGPAGVFVVDAKYTRGKVHVWSHTLRIGGHKTRHLAAMRRQKAIAAGRLSAVVGFAVPVEGVISIVTHLNGSAMTVHAKAIDADVVHVEALFRLMKGKPRHPDLADRQVERITRAARDPATWLPASNRLSARDHQPADTDGPVELADDGDIELMRWTKFGHDRVYANSAANQPLGWIDLTDGEIHDVPDDRDDVTDTLTAIRTQLTATEQAPTEAVPTEPVPDSTAVAPDRDGSDTVGVGQIITAQWRRYGKHRIYANTAAAERLGWIDVATGDIHIEHGADTTTVTQALHTAREQTRATIEPTC